MIYSTLSRLFPTRDPIPQPQRILFIRPCCIGDVVMATGALSALRQTYPQAHITWALGTWSAQSVDYHPAIDAVLDTGSADLPVREWGGFWRFVKSLRAGNFDMAVSLVRSPLMSLAVLLSGIPMRVGLDSAGRGFGYNLRIPIDPDEARHEGDIYLSVIEALAGKSLKSYANLPVLDSARNTLQPRLQSLNIRAPYILAHPGGGSNPGMQMDSKRYPLDSFAQVLNRVAGATSAQVILIGGPKDSEMAQAVENQLSVESVSLVGELTFTEIGALAEKSLLYIGNDTGLTHIASAVGAKTVMIMGPTDPRRYAPYTQNSLALWKPVDLKSGGVATAHAQAWDWSRDGITVDDAVAQILDFIGR